MTNEYQEWKESIDSKYSSWLLARLAILESLLLYFIKGKFPYEVLAGGLAAIIILIIIEVIKKKSKKDDVPEVDERVNHNILTSLYIARISLGHFSVGMIFTMIGNESMPLVYLWVFAFIYGL